MTREARIDAFRQHIASYRLAFNEGRLTWQEYAEFFRVLLAMYALF